MNTQPRNLVLTMAFGDFHTTMASLTVPTIESYAEKIGADFKIITSKSEKYESPFWQKFIAADYLEEYDRVLFLDSDIIVRRDCPSLFDLVPERELGLYNEGLLTTQEEKEGHLKYMQLAFSEYGRSMPQNWDGRFYNTGVMVIPKSMKTLFDKPDHEMVEGYREQGYLNMRIIELDALPMIFDIGYKFNRMQYVESKVKESRFQSYIIHYAGIRTEEILFGIGEDLKIWREFYK